MVVEREACVIYVLLWRILGDDTSQVRMLSVSPCGTLPSLELPQSLLEVFIEYSRCVRLRRVT